MLAVVQSNGPTVTFKLQQDDSLLPGPNLTGSATIVQTGEMAQGQGHMVGSSFLFTVDWAPNAVRQGEYSGNVGATGRLTGITCELQGLFPQPIQATWVSDRSFGDEA
jgi:hypothetical protein